MQVYFLFVCTVSCVHRSQYDLYNGRTNFLFAVCSGPGLLRELGLRRAFMIIDLDYAHIATSESRRRPSYLNKTQILTKLKETLKNEVYPPTRAEIHCTPWP